MKKCQLIHITVPAPGSVVKPFVRIFTDKLYECVSGVYVESNDVMALSNSVFEKFEINGHEVYPVGFASKNITSGQEVNLNNRFDIVTERALGSEINILYLDRGTVDSNNPHIVMIYLRIENISYFDKLSFKIKVNRTMKRISNFFERTSIKGTSNGVF